MAFTKLQVVETKVPTEHSNLIVLNPRIDQIFIDTFGERAYREYREAWAIGTKIEGHQKDFPIQLDFELNYSCNLRCPMCTWSSEVSKDRSCFDLEKFKEIIDEGVKKGLKAIRLNYINEPLLRPDLHHFITYARSKGIIDIMFSTNGVLLRKQEQCEELIKAGLTKIQFSVDAVTPETYAQVRVGTTLEKVHQAIDLFISVKKQLQADLPLIRVNFVLGPHNKHEFLAFAEYWKSKDVDLIATQEYFPLDTVTQNGVKVLNFDKDGTKKSEIGRFHSFTCSIPFRQMTVRNSGEVLPCCSFYGAELVYGNVNKGETISQLWNSPQMKKMRAIHKEGNYQDNPICKKCVESHSYVLD